MIRGYNHLTASCRSASGASQTQNSRRIGSGGRVLVTLIAGGMALTATRHPLEPRTVIDRVHLCVSGAMARGAAFIGEGEMALRNVLFGGHPHVIRGGAASGSTRNVRRYSNNSREEDGLTISASQGLLGINILMYGLQVLTKDSITLLFAKVNQLIMAGQYWRLITPAFFHGNLMHLAVNCYSLYNIAPSLERLTGSSRLVVTYLIAALAGNVASFYGSPAPSLGASGAVFGLGGALAMYFYQNKSLYGKRSDYVLKQLWQTLLINMMYGFANPRIDNYGHVGGLVGGALVAYLLGPRLKIVATDGGSKKYLADVPPIGIFASKPIRIS